MAARGQTDDDRGWGRVSGAEPPLSPAAPLLLWLAGAIVLAALVLGAVRGPGPLDDPEQGDQRTGFLFDVDEEARGVAGLDLPGDPVGGMPVLVVFDRSVPSPPRLGSFIRDVRDEVAVVIVVPETVGERPRLPPGVRLLTGSGGRVAEALGMPQPRAGGAPVGYAVIDAAARVRYATLDPAYEQHGFEVETIVGALR